MSTASRPNLPVIIGNARLFAVKVDLDELFGDEWLFGKIGYVIAGNAVGDYELGTSLRDVLLQMHLILSDAGTRRNQRFFGMPKSDLFDIIWNTIYGDAETGMEQMAEDECWAKHNISLPVDVFDYVRILQFDEGAFSRIIWRTVGDDLSSVTHEARVPIGSTERVFIELSTLLTNLENWEKSTRAK